MKLWCLSKKPVKRSANLDCFLAPCERTSHVNHLPLCTVETLILECSLKKNVVITLHSVHTPTASITATDGIGRVTSPRTNSANRGLRQRAHLQLISANSNPVSNLTGKLLWSGASFKSLNSVAVNSVLLMGFIRLSNNVLISNNKPSYFTCQAIYYLFVFNVWFFVGTRISPTPLVIGPIHLIDTALTLAPPIGGTTHSNGGILAGIVGALYGRMGVINVHGELCYPIIAIGTYIGTIYRFPLIGGATQ